MKKIKIILKDGGEILAVAENNFKLVFTHEGAEMHGGICFLTEGNLTAGNILKVETIA